MLDLQFICEHRDLVIDNCLKRGVTVDVDAVIRLRDARNTLIALWDSTYRTRGRISRPILSTRR